MVFRPATFGKYILLKRIAIGGMAEVFRAKACGAEGFEKLVALKRMLPHLSSDNQFVEMFINEAKLAALLNHVNIAQIYDFGCIDKLYFISMEYIYGKDIADIIRMLRDRNLTCPLEMACFLMIEVLNGLDYAHRFCDPFGNPLGLIHRDVSPHNILVSYEGEVKLVDFGIAKATSSTVHTTGGVLKGKYSYMSPEQAHGMSLDHRSDIFSAAICFYELLTLTKMFQADSDLGVLEKVRETDFAPPRQLNPLIPEELEEIILHALEKNPEDRFESAAQFRDALEQFLFQRHLHYSTSWLSGFMREIFREELLKESAEFAKETEVALKLRSEARRLARISDQAGGPNTLVLHRGSKTTEADDEEEAEDTMMETHEVSPAQRKISNHAAAEQKQPSSPIVEIVEDAQIMPLEKLEPLNENQEEFMPTEKLQRPDPQLFQQVVGKIQISREQPQHPAVKEVFEDDTFDESITTTERQLPPAAIELPVIQEPSYSGANPLLGEDFKLNASTLKEKAQVQVYSPATQKEAEFLKTGEKRFSFSTLVFVLLGVATALVLSLFFFSRPAEEKSPAETLPPRRPADQKRVEPLAQPRPLESAAPMEEKPPPTIEDASPAERASPPPAALEKSPRPAEPVSPPAQASENPPKVASVKTDASEEPPGEEHRLEPRKKAAPKKKVRRPAATSEEEGSSGATATVSVNDSQGWAKVYIDGKLVGESPLINYQLSSGRHVIELRNNNGSTIRRWKVNFPPGANLKLIN
jgi:serine/threonine protein kinase